MSYPGHVYRVIKLKCSIGSQGKNEAKVIMKKPFNDWNQNLPYLIQLTKKRFKCLQTMNDKNWAFMLNGTVMDKLDPAKFGETISMIAPTATIEIVSTTVLSNIVHAITFSTSININEYTVIIPLKYDSLCDTLYVLSLNPLYHSTSSWRMRISCGFLVQ